MVSGQFYFTISGEGVFIFIATKMPYLCGFWRFANAYFCLQDMSGMYYPSILIRDGFGTLAIKNELILLECNDQYADE